MIRITDVETELCIDVPLPNVLEDAFRVQLSRSQEPDQLSAFATQIAAWLAVVVFQVIDRDLWPPSERQRKFALDIGTALGVDVPDEVLTYRGSAHTFLAHYAPMLSSRSVTRRP